MTLTVLQRLLVAGAVMILVSIKKQLFQLLLEGC